ncbi:hypothetical protein GCM10008957_39650 [Deinococcus ruber]|uniref:Uncharacterized protein n=1 Tax=Deinococcus ruber TaxID=1848197 RepID=A0A918CH31_9DEIO|nr:hypothetical protein GCM10008957_39650 [Deinococcus ruber]
MPPDALLGQSVATRRIDQRQAQIDGTVQQRARSVFTHLWAADVPRPEAEHPHPEARFSKFTFQHAGSVATQRSPQPTSCAPCARADTIMNK